MRSKKLWDCYTLISTVPGDKAFASSKERATR
jgi:hypothetical protein